jgi:hypothetical protein
VLKSVLISVDFPRPDSPVNEIKDTRRKLGETLRPRTDNHGSELETLPHTFSMDLVGEVGEPDVAHQLFANDTGKASSVGCWGQRRAGTVCAAV